MINKKEFTDTLSLINQLRKNAENENKEIDKLVRKIESIDEELKLRRSNMFRIEDLLFKKNDELFQLVYNQLPNGEDD